MPKAVRPNRMCGTEKQKKRHLPGDGNVRKAEIPVIDRNGCYVGTLTEGDLLWYIKDHKIVDLHMTEEIPLSQVERRWYNEPVNIDCEIEDLILTSMNQNFVPVIDDKKIFIGIIRRKDIIEYCYNCYKNVAGNEKN